MNKTGAPAAIAAPTTPIKKRTSLVQQTVGKPRVSAVKQIAGKAIAHVVQQTPLKNQSPVKIIGATDKG